MESPIGGGAAGPNPKRQRTSKVLRQREKWIRFSCSNEDRKGCGDRRLNVVPSAKRAPCPRTTPQTQKTLNLEFKGNVLSSEDALEEAFYPVSALGMETT